jgi:hypothetical protein
MATRRRNRVAPAPAAFNPITINPLVQGPKHPRQTPEAIAKRAQRQANRAVPSENVSLSSSPFSSNENEGSARGPINVRQTPEAIAKRAQRQANRAAPSENVSLSSSPFSSNENEGSVQSPIDPRQTQEAIAKRAQRAANRTRVPDRINYAPGDRKNELAPNLFSGGYRRTTRRKYRKHL